MVVINAALGVWLGIGIVVVFTVLAWGASEVLLRITCRRKYSSCRKYLNTVNEVVKAIMILDEAIIQDRKEIKDLYREIIILTDRITRDKTR